MFRNFDIDLPRTSQSQAKAGEHVDREDLRVEIWYSSIQAVAEFPMQAYTLVTDNLHMLPAKKGVRISKLSDSYYEPRYVTARRVLSQENYAKLVGSAS